MAYDARGDRYATMKYNRVGTSGLMLPAISLGLWQNFGSVNEFENCRRILLHAFDRGITHFDAADNYGPVGGSAEETLGRVLARDLKPYRDELIISTKAGYGMWPGPYGDGGSRKHVLASLDQALQRNGLEYVDIFYSHRYDPNTPLEETMGALATAVQQGKALYVGISNYRPKEAREAIELLRQMGVRCLIHQPCYNIYDRWIEDTGLQDLLDEYGMGTICFSPLAQGTLTDKYLNGVPEGSRAARDEGLRRHVMSPEQLDKTRRLNEIAAARGQSLAQMALAWVLRGGRVTSALIGASRVEQVDDSLAALNNLEFAPEELAAIDAVVRG